MYNCNNNQEYLLSCNWARIINRFTRHFAQTYSTSKKAHFDSLPPSCKVVDGARLKWCNLLLLDAIVSILDNETFNSSSRRAFNQQKVLRDSILKELRQTNSKPVEAGNQVFLDKGELFPEDSLLHFEAVNAPWTDLKVLRQTMVDQPTTKSRAKYLQIVDLLVKHSALAAIGFNLQEALVAVVKKVMVGYNALIVNQKSVDKAVSTFNGEGKTSSRATQRSTRTATSGSSGASLKAPDLSTSLVTAHSPRSSLVFPATGEEENHIALQLPSMHRTQRVSNTFNQLMARACRSHADATQLLHDSRYLIPARESSLQAWESGDGSNKMRGVQEGGSKKEGSVAPPTTPEPKKRRVSQGEEKSEVFTPLTTPEKFMFTPAKEQQHLFSTFTSAFKPRAPLKLNDDPLPHWSRFEKYSLGESIADHLSSPVLAEVSAPSALNENSMGGSGDQYDQDFWDHMHGLLDTQFGETHLIDSLTDSGNSTHFSSGSTSGSPTLFPLQPSWCGTELPLPAPVSHDSNRSTTSECGSSSSSAMQEVMFSVSLENLPPFKHAIDAAKDSSVASDEESASSSSVTRVPSPLGQEKLTLTIDQSMSN